MHDFGRKNLQVYENFKILFLSLDYDSSFSRFSFTSFMDF